MSLGQEILIHPSTKVTTDIFHFQDDSYLLIVDYMSRFPILHKLTSTTAQQVACQMKLIFSEYGWPETIVSDNGPCYSAETFTKLVTDYSVNHITSSPHYPQSSCLAEKYVQIVKNLFHKAQGRGYRSIQKFNDIQKIHCYQISCNHLCRCLHPWTARTQLPMSNAARAQQGLGSEQLRVNSKNKHLPTHNFPSRSKYYVSKPHEQKMVSSHNHKPMSRT